MIDKSFSLALIAVSLLSSCYSEPTFVLDDEARASPYLSTKWEDSIERIRLVFRGEDLGGMGSVAWLSLEKVLPDGDTVSYRLRGDSDNYNRGSATVIKDTLYFYKGDLIMSHHGWYQTHDKGGIRNMNYVENLPIDTVGVTDGIYGGIYKWQGNGLVYFGSNSLSIDELTREDAIFYIAPPGIEVGYKFSTDYIKKRLSIHSIGDAPAVIEHIE